MGYSSHMLLWAVVILAAWILLSLPVALVVGRMFAARPESVARPTRTPSMSAERVAHLSRIESRRCAASRWPHEAWALAEARRREAVTSGGFARTG